MCSLAYVQDYEIFLSTRPDESIGDDNYWELATNGLIEALERKGWKYSINAGDGAFYGPKIDLKIKDALGRRWQCSTVQCDFNLPNRFELEYIAPDGSKQRPVMIHRAIFGSVERFFGIITENCAGEFPLWLAPGQLRLLPINDDVVPFCTQVAADMKAAGIRCEIDDSAERVQKKIRNAEIQKVPLTAVVGPAEAEGQSLAMRARFMGDLGSMPLAEVRARIERAVDASAQIVDGADWF